MQVSRLYIHPVKSLGGVPVQHFDVDRFGPLWDRRWLVVDEQGQFLTQRQHARMALVRAALVDGRVSLSAPDCAEITFNADDFKQRETTRVQVWRDECQALRGPVALDQWLSDYLDVTCRVVFMPESTRRRVDPGFAQAQETVSFADGFPLLLTNEASLQDFNSHLSFAIGMERFRPNLVIEGAAPYAEDSWRRIRVGEMEFRVVKPCSRCAIPTLDPTTGKPQAEVFQTLKRYRARDNEVYFGQNLLPVGTGSVRVGDAVVILE